MKLLDLYCGVGGASGEVVKMRWRSAIFALGNDNVLALRKLGKVKQ